MEPSPFQATWHGSCTARPTQACYGGWREPMPLGHDATVDAAADYARLAVRLWPADAATNRTSTRWFMASAMRRSIDKECPS